VTRSLRSSFEGYTFAMNPNIRANEIAAAFQRYVNTGHDSEIADLSSQEVRSADEQLGQRDVGAGFRIAMQNRISDLQLIEQRKHESNVRAWNYVAGVFTGLLVAGLGAFIFGG
jgi:hypothetical protein